MKIYLAGNTPERERGNRIDSKRTYPKKAYILFFPNN